MGTNRLGYTWWPKDWASSQKVQSMNIVERGIYRELIDLVMDAESKIKVNQLLWSRLWRITKEELSSALNSLVEIGAITINGDELWIPSCEQRLSKTSNKRDSSRENGKNGGRPKKPKNNPMETQQQPNSNPMETQWKPNGFTTETETETETKTENKQKWKMIEQEFISFAKSYAKKYGRDEAKAVEQARLAFDMYTRKGGKDNFGNLVTNENWQTKLMNGYLSLEKLPVKKFNSPI